MHITKQGQTVDECGMEFEAAQFRQHQAAVAVIFRFESVYSLLNYVLILGMVLSPALQTNKVESDPK